MTNPHKFVPVVDRSWCFIHNGWEPIYENNYRVCGECGHSYWTAQALILREYEERREAHFRWPEDFPMANKVDDSATILSCPICGHDW